MKISINWLHEWVNPSVDFDELTHRLTMAGLELDGIEPAAAEFTGVVIGEILSVDQHPDAERLKVCQVNVNQDENLQIVTNVQNVVPTMKVPVATIGAKLPGESADKPFKIKKTKLRGELSQGMFCGADTLGVNDGSDGLLELPEDAPVGTNIRDYMELDDQIIELDLTPNRADCLSVEGVAREVGVLTKTAVNTPEIASVAASHDETFPVDVKDNDACARYAGRIIKNIDPTAQTPLWMKEKLRRAGLRSLSPVVDVTNFILLELGQPMHAFDLAKLDSGIQVRFANNGEPLTLLDGQEIKLKDNSLVIADQNSAIALAGIMGGEPTSVTDETKDIFLESAFFKPEIIAGRARQYGLHTDSSHRFERGVSPDLQVRAIERATQLILDICGGEAGSIIDVDNAEALRNKQAIQLRRQRVTHMLGVTIADDMISDMLQRLGCELEANDEGWLVTPPAFRFDMSIEADLIEEVARIYGYDNIPAVLRPFTPRISVPKEGQVSLNSLRDVLINRAYQEVVTFSFVDVKVESLLAPEQKQTKLANPLSADLEVMRTTLWSGMLKAVASNMNRQQNRLRFFETGLTFIAKDDGLEQHKKLSGMTTGSLYQEQWSAENRPVDFYDVKGDVEELLAQASSQKFTFNATDIAALHPGQAAAISNEQGVIGYVGALHPRIQKQLGLNQTVFMFELDLGMMMERKIPEYHQVSRYPSIRRDLALLLDENVTVNAINAAIDKIVKKEAISQLVDYTLFDVYSGEGLEKGKKSIALGLILQDFSRTLEDAEINRIVELIVESLFNETGAVLR